MEPEKIIKNLLKIKKMVKRESNKNGFSGIYYFYDVIVEGTGFLFEIKTQNKIKRNELPPIKT